MISPDTLSDDEETVSPVCGVLSGAESGGTLSVTELSDEAAGGSVDTGADDEASRVSGEMTEETEVLSDGTLTSDGEFTVEEETVSGGTAEDVETDRLSFADDSTSDETLSENSGTLSSTKASPTDGSILFPTKATTAMPINIKTAAIKPLRNPISFTSPSPRIMSLKVL